MSDSRDYAEALEEFRPFIEPLQGAFTVAARALPLDVQRTPKRTRGRGDPWFKAELATSMVEFGCGTDMFSARLEVVQVTPGHDKNGRQIPLVPAPLPWSVAKQMYRLSPHTAKMRDARSWLDWKLADDPASVVLTNEAQLEFAIAEVLPRWMSDVTLLVNRVKRQVDRRRAPTATDEH